MLRHFILFSVMCLPLVAAADHNPPKYPVEMADFQLRIMCNSKPVQGASVRLYACRCEEDPGSHYGWPIHNTDAPTELTSDDKGKVTVKWPVKFGSPENWLTTSQISMTINHPEYVPEEVYVDPREKRATLEMKAGCELSFSAIDSGRKPLQIGVLMAGPARGAKWFRDADGAVHSRAIPDGNWQAMLVLSQFLHRIARSLCERSNGGNCSAICRLRN